MFIYIKSESHITRQVTERTWGSSNYNFLKFFLTCNYFVTEDPFENDLKSMRGKLEWWREELPEILCMCSMLNRRQALWSLVILN